MGTKLNKKNEKRKNIHRIFVGTRYKKERSSPSPLPQRATLYTHLLGSYKRQLDVQKSVVLSLL